ncbi:MAG: CotH kinase family protein [Acidobacteria bacterium]|nr:CotH kinase family protein [Acidobacteriota bacterium]
MRKIFENGAYFSCPRAAKTRRFAALIAFLAAGLLVSSCAGGGTKSVPEETGGLTSDLLKSVDETFESDLPIVIIDTGGLVIPDELKIDARMIVIDNPPGERNRVTDLPALDVQIGIEIRGSTSQRYPKKQYGFETRDEAGDDLDVPFLGFPEESDWVLHAPYADKSLMRNHLAYTLWRRMGRYASRTRFVEVLFRESETEFAYNGVYVGMEKIKRDGDRVDIEKIRDDLSGGYILKVDWPDPDEWFFTGPNGVDVIVEYPKAEDITPAQQAWIVSFVDDLHASLPPRAPGGAFAGYIDAESFIDFLLLREFFKDVDTYRASTYFHKDKTGLLCAGPVWDFNASSGNGGYMGLDQPEGWMLDIWQDAAAWWRDLLVDDGFRDLLVARWEGLRIDLLSQGSVDAAIEETSVLLEEAAERNFRRWRVLGVYVWPNVSPIGETWEEEIERLRDWLHDRGAWMDGNIGEIGRFS